MMNVTGEDGQQQNMGYVQFSSPQAAAAAQKVGRGGGGGGAPRFGRRRPWSLNHSWHAVSNKAVCTERCAQW